MSKTYRLVLRGVLGFCAAALSAGAGTWVNGNGDWNNSNTANWSTGLVPAAAETISLTQSTTSSNPIAITYAATTAVTGSDTVLETRYGPLTLGNAGGGTTTLYIDGTDMLACGASGLSDATISLGGKLDVSGGTFSPRGSLNLAAGGQIVQSGGLIHPYNYDLAMTGGVYSISNGNSKYRLMTLNPSSGTATFTQTGGTVTTTVGSTALNLTPTATGSAAYNLSAGSLLITNYASINMSGNAAFTLSGTGAIGSAVAGETPGNANQTGGTYTQTGGSMKLVYDWTVGAASFGISGGTASLRNLIASPASGTATINLTGGTITSTANTTGMNLAPTGTGTAVCTINNATLQFPSSGNIIISNNGTMTLTGTGAIGLGAGGQNPGYITVNAGGTYTQNSATSSAKCLFNFAVNGGGQASLSAGTLTAGTLYAAPSSGVSTINLTGGTMDSTASSGNKGLQFVPTGTGSVNYTISSGAHTFSGFGDAILTGNATLQVTGTGSLGLPNDTKTPGYLTLDQGATYLQDSGSANIVFELGVNGGQMTISGGTVKCRGLNVGTTGGTGTLTITGGTVTYGRNVFSYNIGGATGSGTVIVKGGAFQGVNNYNQPDATIGVTGTLRGYVTNGGNSNGVLKQSGRVIADGDGVDRTLDLSSFTSGISNPTDNTATSGWFATKHGKLVLPAITVPASGSVSWGETSTDTTPDMINSVAITSVGVSSGTLSVSLLADDRIDVAAALAPVVGLNPPFTSDTIGLFKFDRGTFSFGSGNLTLTVRYDDTLLVPDAIPANLVRLWMYDGTAWSNVYGSIDTANKRITSTAINSAVFGAGATGGLLAVTVPEPGALFLLGLGGLLLARRRVR